MPRKPMPETKRINIACRLKPENIEYLKKAVSRRQAKSANATGHKRPNFGRVIDDLLDAARSAGIEN